MLAETSGISRQIALETIDCVRQAVSQWPKFAKAAHVTAKSREIVGEAI